MNIKDDPVYQDKLRKMHAVRRYLKIREKVYIARRDAGFNVREEERLRSWLSEYACYLEADAHWLKEDYERRMGKDEPSYEPSIVIPKGDVEDAGFNVREEERLRSWLSEYACYLEADAHWLKEDYERRMGKDEPSYEPSIVIPKGDVEKAVKYGCFSQMLGSLKKPRE